MRSYVYFIQRADGAIKIGYSASPRARFAVLTKQHGRIQIRAIMPGTMTDERVIHASFSKHHIGGEWFRPAPEIEEAIRIVVDEHGAPSLNSAPDQMIQSAIRMPPSYRERARALVDYLSRKRGIRITLTEVLREAMILGLEDMWREEEP